MLLFRHSHDVGRDICPVSRTKVHAGDLTIMFDIHEDVVEDRSAEREGALPRGAHKWPGAEGEWLNRS